MYAIYFYHIHPHSHRSPSSSQPVPSDCHVCVCVHICVHVHIPLSLIRLICRSMGGGLFSGAWQHTSCYSTEEKGSGLEALNYSLASGEKHK